jgi:hypothetical protein
LLEQLTHEKCLANRLADSMPNQLRSRDIIMTEEQQQKLAAIEQASRSGKKLNEEEIAFLKNVFETEIAQTDSQTNKRSEKSD